jgi:hypothetical protein
MHDRDPRLAHLEDEPPPGTEQRLWGELSSKLDAPAPPAELAYKPSAIALLGSTVVIVGAVIAWRPAAPEVTPPQRMPSASPLPVPPERTPPPSLAQTSSLGAETALLREAQAALRKRDAGGALAAIERHAASFPRGILAQERDALRAIALCTLHDPRAAATRRTFLRDWPASSLSPRVRQACDDAVGSR